MPRLFNKWTMINCNKILITNNNHILSCSVVQIVAALKISLSIQFTVILTF